MSVMKTISKGSTDVHLSGADFGDLHNQVQDMSHTLYYNTATAYALMFLGSAICIDQEAEWCAPTNSWCFKVVKSVSREIVGSLSVDYISQQVTWRPLDTRSGILNWLIHRGKDQKPANF